MRLSKGLSGFKGALHHGFIPMVLCLYGLAHPVALIMGVGLFVRAFVHARSVACLFTVMTLIVIAHDALIEPTPIEGTQHTGQVVSTEFTREHPRVVVKTSQGRIMVYCETLSDAHYTVGDILTIEGEVSIPRENGFFGGFDYPQYLRATRVEGVIYATQVERSGHETTLHALPHTVRETVLARTPQSGPYINAFLFAERTMIDETYTQAQALGIAHLFAVSGMHVGVFVMVVGSVLKRLMPQGVLRDAFLFIALLAYGFVCGFPPSVLRAVSFFILYGVNKRINGGFTAVDCLITVCTVTLLIHPPMRHLVGFVLSFLVAFMLVVRGHSPTSEHWVKRSLKVSGCAFLVTLPIIASMSGSVNVLAPLINIVYVLLLGTVLLPLAYLTMILPFLDTLYAGVLLVFESLVSMSIRWMHWPLSVHVPAGIATVIYYIALGYFMGARGLKETLRRSAYLLSVCAILLVWPVFKPVESFVMYDVSGDAFLLRDSFNRCNILIDTGDNDPHDNLVRALKRTGVRHLDYVFITHLHADHYGGYESVRDALPVKTLITNETQKPYEATIHECGTIEFYIVPLEYPHRSSNNRSLVLFAWHMDKTMLFTGDIETPREATFTDAYDIQAQWLKVGHHGSATSTTEGFLDMVGPEKAFVSATRSNRFDHPSPRVIDRLESRGIRVVRLDICGSVHIRKIGPIMHKSCAIGE